MKIIVIKLAENERDIKRMKARASCVGVYKLTNEQIETAKSLFETAIEAELGSRTEPGYKIGG